MRSVSTKKVAVAGTLAAATCAALLASFVPSSVSAPSAGVPASEASISPLAIMTQAPRGLPIQHYDSH